ncbi:ABC transporter ATP-binding protein [Paenibacillus eucommiae]|uniref:ATP-binding cassette subfamily B protein n=1 Tax=Paenibacillus eucommiae TaxID=1355755 RepID=A0ABS4IVL7_9BACL|nr:ABC transporter ATP-binding protein [Paenibacillus eucommiae]MBP1990881.1 ATP-binding cassette subfamily B protein [Paenibacillus eucommiae]
MKNNALTMVRSSIFQLIYRVWRSMPILSLVWLGIPLLLGVLIVPGFSAQRELVDLFVGGGTGLLWNEMVRLAWPPLAVFTGISLLRAALSALHNITDARFRDRATMQIQAEVHQKAVNVPLEQMEEAEYYNRLQRSKDTAGTDLFGVLQNVIAFLRLFFEFIGLFIVMWLADPILGVLLVIVFSLSFAIRLESDIVVRRLNRDLTQSGRQSDYLRAVLTKPETVKEMRIFGSMGYLIGKWNGIMGDSLALRMNARRREIKHGIVVSSVQITSLIGAVTWMVMQMKAGGFTAGTFVIVFLAMRQAHSISSRMAHPISKIYIQSSKVFDLVEFLSMKPQESGAEAEDTTCSDYHMVKELILGGTSQALKKNGKIVFENVHYQYSSGFKPALSNICLSLNPGETVALVGENGAGKSTLVRLLLGLYSPTSGRMTWDGTDYRQLDPDLIRGSMSAVFQDYVRYETTLRDNVGFGLPDHIHNDIAIRRALQVSGAASLEETSDGLDAKIGLLSAGGRELSGGQWQRLAIARAALRNPQLLVLDEPTAALDPQHETELYQSFREMAEGKTVLFVSHRLGWARFANRIVVLKAGQIVEEGTHETLLAADGQYAAMFRAQAQWYRGA